MATASAATRQNRPRTAKVPPIAQRRPCEKRSRNGPISGATTANGSMVRPRNSATWSAGAAGVGEEDGARERDRDRRVARGVERVELDQPGEPGAAGALGVRCPARPAERGRGGALARATGRGDAPAGRAERAATPPGNRARRPARTSSGRPRSGCGAVAGSTAPSCQVAPRRAAVTRRAGEPSGMLRISRRLPAVISTADHPGTSGSDSLAGADPILTRAVDEARAALVEQVGADVVGDTAGLRERGRARRHAVLRLHAGRLPRLALGGHRGARRGRRRR